MKKDNKERNLPEIKKRNDPEEVRLAKFVSEHPDLAIKAIAKWIKDSKEEK